MDDPYVAPVLQEPGIIPLTLLYLMSHSNHSNNHSGTFSSLVENTWDVQYKQYKYINIRLPVQPESTRRTCLWSSFEILQQNQNYRQSFHLVSIKGNLQIIRYNVGDDWVNLFAMCSYHSGSNACSVRQNSRDGESAFSCFLRFLNFVGRKFHIKFSQVSLFGCTFKQTHLLFLFFCISDSYSRHMFHPCCGLQWVLEDHSVIRYYRTNQE